jgi:hypothetical protein
MKKCIADIKSPVLRRSSLCSLFPAFVVAAVVVAVWKSSIGILRECLEVFVLAWKGN